MISVVVCTYNRATALRRMLDAFFAQTDLDTIDHELIVVDNNSPDHTRTVVNESRSRGSLRYFLEERQGLSCARNRGVAESSGEIVAFLDDDVIVDPKWLSCLHECFESTGAAVVGGRSYLIYELEPPNWLGADFRKQLAEVDLGPSRKAVPDGRGLFGLNLSFRRSALEMTNGFDEALGRSGAGLLSGEETVVVRSIAEAGGVVIYDPDAVVGHIIGTDRLQWAYFKKLARGIGRSLALSDRPAGLPIRLARIIRSTLALVRTTLIVGWLHAAPTTPYHRKSALRRWITARSRLTVQCARLWRRR